MKKIFLLLLFSKLALAEPFINQANIFSGEVASNLTTGAPLSTSSTGKITTGLNFNSVVATSTTTTTSTTDVLITTMTATPVAGVYLVFASTTLQENTNNVNVFFSIYANNAQISGSEVEASPQIQGGVTPSLNIRIPTMTFAFVTVNGSQAIEARWRVSAASTATATTRQLGIMRIQ